MGKPDADIDGLIDCGVETFHTGCDQKGIKAHFAGDGMCDHVADDHPVAAFFQSLQRMTDFFHAVDGENVQIEIQQTAQRMSRFCNAGKAYDRIQIGIVSASFMVRRTS